MGYTHKCPECGAYLDYGEICDCAKKDRPDAGGQHQGGKGKNPLTLYHILGGLSNETKNEISQCHQDLLPL